MEKKLEIWEIKLFRTVYGGYKDIMEMYYNGLNGKNFKYF